MLVVTVPHHTGSPLFPYTTLFRSNGIPRRAAANIVRANGRPLGRKRQSLSPGRTPSSASAPVRRHTRSAKSPYAMVAPRSEEHTSELQSHHDLVCRLLLEKKKPTQ